MCRSGEFDLSFESITSDKALALLRDVQKNDPETWSKISLRGDKVLEAYPEDSEEGLNVDFDAADDSSLTVADATNAIVRLSEQGMLTSGIDVDGEDNLMASTVAEDPFEDDVFDDSQPNQAEATQGEPGSCEEEGDPSLRRSKRRRIEKIKYDPRFWD